MKFIEKRFLIIFFPTIDQNSEYNTFFSKMTHLFDTALILDLDPILFFSTPGQTHFDPSFLIFCW